jgi:hypothetical protein
MPPIWATTKLCIANAATTRIIVASDAVEVSPPMPMAK